MFISRRKLLNFITPSAILTFLYNEKSNAKITEITKDSSSNLGINKEKNVSISNIEPIAYKIDDIHTISRNIEEKFYESISVKDFGAFGDAKSDDTESIINTINFCIRKNKTCFFPDGVYVINKDKIIIQDSISIELSPNAHLEFNLIISGKNIEHDKLINIEAEWEKYPPGTTLIHGNFHQFKKSDIIAITLSGNGNAKYNNEIGMDFSSVDDLGTNFIKIKTPTRLSYINPNIYGINSAIKYNGTLEKDTYIIYGDYSSNFEKNNILRIENIDGSDGVNSSKYYFEFAKIQYIDKKCIVLKSRLNFTHINPWLIKTGFINGVKLSGGGSIRQLEIRNVDSVNIDNTSIDRIIISHCYDVRIDGVNMQGVSQPSTSNITYCFGRTLITNIRASSSKSNTDNAAFKIMSCPKAVISGIVTENTTNTGKSGNYGFFVDALFSPYLIWNDGLIISNVIVEPPRGGSSRGAWFYGMRNSIVNGINGAHTYFQGCVDCSFSDIQVPNYQLEIKDLSRCKVTAATKFMVVSGCHQSTFDISTKGVSKNKNSVEFISGGINPETGEDYQQGAYNKVEVENFNSNKTTNTIHISNQLYLIVGSKSRDLDSISSSITIGNNVEHVRIEPNALSGKIPKITN